MIEISDRLSQILPSKDNVDDVFLGEFAEGIIGELRGFGGWRVYDTEALDDHQVVLGALNKYLTGYSFIPGPISSAYSQVPLVKFLYVDPENSNIVSRGFAFENGGCIVTEENGTATRLEFLISNETAVLYLFPESGWKHTSV